jgi:hypothetical protein
MIRTLLLSFVLLTLNAIQPSVAYDASWYRADSWGGEYPNGFTVSSDTTIMVRSKIDLKQKPTIPCQLTKGATFHPWNEKRVASDHLNFATFSKIEKYISKEKFGYTAPDVKEG